MYGFVSPLLQEVKDNPDSPTSSSDETREKEEKDEKKMEESGEKQEVKKTDIEKTENQTETITKTITVTKKEKKGTNHYLFINFTYKRERKYLRSLKFVILIIDHLLI